MASNKQTLTIRPDADLRQKLVDFAAPRGISLTAAINIVLYDYFKKKVIESDRR